jgi:hypothetical protein
MNDTDYQTAVASIPHLNLTKYLPAIPVTDIIRELELQQNKISKFDYGVAPNTQQAQHTINYLKSAWHGFSLIDITADGQHMIDYYSTGINHPKVISKGVEITDSGYANTRITNIGEEMPITVQYILSFLEEPGRCRISRLTAGKIIDYHSHFVKAQANKNKIAKSNLNRATLHIPLITNSDCNFLVSRLPPNNTSSADNFKPIEMEYKQHYSVGEIWMFNSYHYHRAENFSNVDRDHVLIYFDHMDNKIRPFIEQAINEYTGPHIHEAIQ